MKIYVVTHKNIDINLPKDYVVFQAGAAVNGVVCAENDAVGDDNISVKNPNYCELTAAYWIWKNDKTSDIVGLMHYRRFLTTHVFSNSLKYFIDENTAELLLKEYDYIASPLYKNKPNVKAMLLDTVKNTDFTLLRNSVSRLYPEYLQAFDEVFNGKFTYFCNMFITRKEEWDEYYKWLFSILFDMERYVDMTGYSDEEKRLYGFLAERLFTVYVKHNDKRVKSIRMIRPKKSIITRIAARFRRIKNK